MARYFKRRGGDGGITQMVKTPLYIVLGIALGIIGLMVGNSLLVNFNETALGTCGPLYASAMKLVGYSLTNYTAAETCLTAGTGFGLTCPLTVTGGADAECAGYASQNVVVYDTTGSGLLNVIGLVLVIGIIVGGIVKGIGVGIKSIKF